MRYSKKGQQKLADFLYANGAYVAGLRANEPATLRFEPDDFEGVVVLTTKEAKELIYLLSQAKDLRYIPYGYETCDEWAQLLTKRIEKSVMSKIST